MIVFTLAGMGVTIGVCIFTFVYNHYSNTDDHDDSHVQKNESKM